MDHRAKYASPVSVTAGKVVATVLVVTWIVTAFFIGGFPTAIRVAIFFMAPLLIIWIPDLMAKLAENKSVSTRLEGAPMPWGISPVILTFVAWLVILGVPAVWGMLHLMTRR